MDGPETLWYVDPPYVHETRGLKQWRTPQSYRHEMTDEDHKQMAEVLRSIKGTVVLSGYQSPLYESLFGDWHIETKDAHADGARDRVEVLWINRAPFKSLFSQVPA
jgi:DNA adenine methylase